MTFGKCQGGGRRAAKRVTAPQPALLITMSDRHRALRSTSREPEPKCVRRTCRRSVPSCFSRSVTSASVHTSRACGLKFEQEIRDWDVERLHYEASRGTKASLHAA